MLHFIMQKADSYASPFIRSRRNTCMAGLISVLYFIFRSRNVLMLSVSRCHSHSWLSPVQCQEDRFVSIEPFFFFYCYLLTAPSAFRGGRERERDRSQYYWDFFRILLVDTTVLCLNKFNP